MSARRIALAVTSLTLAACSADPIAPASAPNESPSFALAADQNVKVVTEDDVDRAPENTPVTNNWMLYTRAGTPSTAGAFEPGPGQPPLGVGSLQLATATGIEKVYLFNYDHVGTKLSEIAAMGYATYRVAGSAQQVAALNLQVDVNGAAPGGFTTLVFEPVYNTDQGRVVSGTWQEWDAYRGGSAIWWSSNPIPGAPNRDTFVSLATIMEANPDAVIVGGVGINQGSGNLALTTAVDAFTFDETTYDFEPYRVAADVNACKDGGWRSVKDATGGSFRNQGDCVSYVARRR